MSGGSHNYAYFHVDQFEAELFGRPNAKRAAFQKLLKYVAQAMHDIEWVDSGDCGPGDEYEAIDACFKFAKEFPYDQK